VTIRVSKDLGEKGVSHRGGGVGGVWGGGLRGFVSWG